MHDNNSNPDSRPHQSRKDRSRQAQIRRERTDEAGYQKLPHDYRPFAGRAQRDPLDYDSHPYPSMKRFAEFLALRFNTPRTRHSYYRQMRLVHEHCQADPAIITEAGFRDYVLHVKTVKGWKPKTIRQAAAAAKLFFVDLMEHHDWKVFSQIRTKDEETLPAVLTREEVIRLLSHTYVSFRWKDRAHGDALRIETIEGGEFVARYLRHVLPRGLRAVRHYGYCHPAAKEKRERIAFHTGRPLLIDTAAQAPEKAPRLGACTCCGGEMRPILRLLPAWQRARPPPVAVPISA